MENRLKLQILSVTLATAFGMVLGGVLTLEYIEERYDHSQPPNGALDRPFNLTDEEWSLNDLFHSVEDSVVYIEANPREEDEIGFSQGSGFVYSEEGFIVTNEHVVSGEETARVTFTDGSTKTAEVIGVDDYNDLAVLEVEKDDLQALPLANYDETLVGQRVVALGSPFGLRGSMTVGYVSQKDRVLQTGGGFSIPNVIQTDAAINPGNSGGPLLNTRGEVVGVNTAIQSQTGTSTGVGFAVPSSAVERVVPELIENGDYQHSWLGVEGIDMNEELAEEMGAPNTTGFLVADVVEDGPSDRADIRGGDRNVEIRGQNFRVGGDIIVGIDDREVRDIEDILAYLARETEVGDEVEVRVWRDGDIIEKTVELESRPN